MSETRKLVAILAADVVGYSRLMGEDEAGTARAVREHRDAARPIVASHGGRIVKTMGDGVLLEFPSVVAAVECAIAIQKLMTERNLDTPEPKRIRYRMGVNLGDVLVDGDDILGDGVNIAARLEGIAEPGGICLSGGAYDHVRGRIDASFVDLGAIQLKNIAEPIRVYSVQVEVPAQAGSKQPEPKKRPIPALVGAGIAGALASALLTAGWLGWRTWPPPPTPAASVAAVNEKLAAAPRLSIVVLPFENLSSDPDQGYFADGITDDLTTDLSHLPESFVISPGTAFTYKGKAVDAKQIGHELGVRYVLEGSVRRVGEKVAINAQLISTENGAHVWADRFDGEHSKLGQLQVEFVSRLANSLGVELVKAESLRSMRERPGNPDAVDLAMRGWALINQTDTKERFTEAISLFDRALSIDPQNVQAMTGLALVLIWRASNGWADDRAGDLARAEGVIDRALMLQPESSWLHHANASILAEKHQWGPAVAEEERAVAYDRNNADAHAVAGYFKQFLGRSEEGLSDLETALRLSPRGGGVPSWQYFICSLHTKLGNWEQAIEWCNKSIAGNPELFAPLVNLAVADAWAGHDKEAKDAVARIQKANPGFSLQKLDPRDQWTDDPTFKTQWARLVEGLRKAGLPEE